jgi:hypothetical protein
MRPGEAKCTLLVAFVSCTPEGLSFYTYNLTNNYLTLTTLPCEVQCLNGDVGACMMGIQRYNEQRLKCGKAGILSPATLP